jgi:formylmethanofuran--tetrahydromethanopterin N-formyltransferase
MSQMPLNLPEGSSNKGEAGKGMDAAQGSEPVIPARPTLKINGVLIRDTFAEAFDMRATRIIITAAEAQWAKTAAESMTGFATSIIACGVEAGIERILERDETPDGRPGVAVLVFGMSTESLEKRLIDRVGQSVLTCPTTSVFGGLEVTDRKLELGAKLRFFGDGRQISKMIGRERYWRIPVMDGEFVCQHSVYATKAVGGGNFLVLAKETTGALRACEAAVSAIRQVRGCIAPFPGGVVRSGSKVGSKYSAQKASTNEQFCPSLRNVPGVKTAIPDEAGTCLEVVIDGLTPAAVAEAMRVGILAACEKKEWGVVEINAGNYGGKLGRHHFYLHQVLADIALSKSP